MEIIGSVTNIAVVIGACLACVCSAQADDHVRLWESNGLRPGLCAALRIQLADVSEVTCGPDPHASLALSERIARAAESASKSGATLVVLLERDPEPSRVRMFLVAARTDEALIAIEQVENRPEPDVDRSLALKVRDSVDAVRRYQTVSDAPTLPLTVAIAKAPKVKPQDRASPAPWALGLEGGGAGVLGRQNRAAGVLSAGASLHRARSYLAVMAEGHLLSAAEERDEFGEVKIAEWGLGLSVRGGLDLGRTRLGLSLAPQLTTADAQGTTASGVAGSRQVLAFSCVVGLDLRVRLTPQLWLRFSPGIEVFAVKQRFALDDHVTLDMGRSRALLPLTLLFELPLGKP